MVDWPKKSVCKLLFLFLLASPLYAQEIFPDYRPHLERELAYRYPTERFIEAHGWDCISSNIKSLGVSMVHRNLFDRVWHREELGFLGYHGTTQEYRIYQDIIRLIIEEHLGMPIRDDFHFFRIPGDPQFHCQTLQEYGSYQHAYSPSHFLCMNYALYGNFHNPFSCSYYYFAANSSANTIRYEAKLVWLFEKLGIDPEAIKDAFTIGRHHLSDEKGILLQVFDMSHYNPWKPYYALADQQCGTFANAPFSHVVAGKTPSVFPCQIRLLMSNRHTLNPYSSLVIKRYDTLDPQVIHNYEAALRRFIGSLEADKERVGAYKQELLKVWEVDDVG